MYIVFLIPLSLKDHILLDYLPKFWRSLTNLVPSHSRPLFCVLYWETANGHKKAREQSAFTDNRVLQWEAEEQLKGVISATMRLRTSRDCRYWKKRRNRL